MKYDTIVLEGIDKTGKDTILRYICELSNYKYLVQSREILSQIAYSQLYTRDYEYQVKDRYNNVLFVYLTVDREDWNIRCNMTNEPVISYDDNIKVFNDAVYKYSGYINIIKFDTSKKTPYQIAKKIVEYMNELNEVIK